MTTLDTEAPLIFHRTLTHAFKSDSISGPSNCLHMSIPPDNATISRRISCSISGLSNQCNETQSTSSSGIFGRWAAHTDQHWFTFPLHVPVTAVCLAVSSTTWELARSKFRGSWREMLSVEIVMALCNPSDYQDGRNTSSSLPNQLSRLASPLPYI